MADEEPKGDVNELIEFAKNPPIGDPVEQLKSVDLQESLERDKERLARLRAEEEERRLADAVASFSSFRIETPCVWMCPYCAALVGNREQHVRWHDAVHDRLAKGESAYFHTMPIG